MRKFPIPEGCEIIDAEGLFVGPGLIDIHNHAGNGHWFFDEPIEAAQFNPQHGTTTILACLYFNMNQQQLAQMGARARESILEMCSEENTLSRLNRLIERL
jgi:N-acetylglucosamine-6-phosphate deacetylase